MPYGHCVIYSITGDEQETLGRARTSPLPIFKQQPGFVAYGVIGQDGENFSMSAWQSENDAKAADEAARPHGILRASRRRRGLRCSCWEPVRGTDLLF